MDVNEAFGWENGIKRKGVVISWEKNNENKV